MDKFIIKKDSWHFHIVDTYSSGWNIYDPDNNICSYTKAVLKGVFAIVMISLVGGLATACIGDALIFWTIVVANMRYFDEPSIWGVFGTAIVSVLTFMFGAFAIKDWYDTRRIRKLHQPEGERKQPGFIVAAYRSIKDKYCIKAELEQ